MIDHTEPRLVLAIRRNPTARASGNVRGTWGQIQRLSLRLLWMARAYAESIEHANNAEEGNSGATGLRRFLANAAKGLASAVLSKPKPEILASTHTYWSLRPLGQT